jgi:Domain of unknown function (DUF4214)
MRGRRKLACLAATAVVVGLFAVPARAAGGVPVLGREAGNSDAYFLTSVYRDLLHRPISPSELAASLTQLTQERRGVLSLTLVSSQEYRVKQTGLWYGSYLHRPADPTSLAFFSNALASTTDEVVQSWIISSPEYFVVRGGSTIDGFLAAVYQDLLGRAPSAQELSNGEAFLASHSRSQLVQAIFPSHEYRIGLIRSDYHALLHRAPTGAEKDAFLQLLQNGGTDEDILVAIVSSPEYAPDPWVQTAYQDLLHRGPDPTELSAAGAFLDDHSRGVFAGHIMGSDEYRMLLVRAWYVRFLSRPPTPDEEKAGLEELSRGGTDEVLIALLMGSPEYFTNRGGGKNRGFVIALYADLLGRAPSSRELNDDVDLLKAGMPRRQLVGTILSSPEYFTVLVNGAFGLLLGRETTAAERHFYRGLLASGATDEQVKATLMGSAEYRGAPVVEGRDAQMTVATFSVQGALPPASAFSASIDWGDGTAATPGSIVGDGLGGFDVMGTHAYTEEGAYAIDVSVSSAGGIPGVAPAVQTSEPSSVHVIDPSPVASGGRSLVATQGKRLSHALLATFVDPDPFDLVGGKYQVVVDWGDATTSRGSVVAGPSEHGYSVLGSHTYSDRGTFQVSITVRHDLAAPVVVVDTITVQRAHSG